VGFRRRASRAGVTLSRTLLPVQTVDSGVDGAALHRALLRCGVATVLRARATDGRARVSFVITARHSADQIDEALHHLGRALSMLSTATTHEDDDDVDHTRWLHPDHAALPGAAPASPVAAAH